MNLMKKLLLGFLSVILLLIIVTGYTYTQFTSVDNSYATTIKERTGKTTFATYAIFETYKEQNTLRNYLITGDKEELNNYSLIREEFQKNIEGLKSDTVNKEGLALIDNMIAAEEAYNKVAEKVFALKQKDDTEGYMTVMEEEGNTVIANMDAAAKDLLFYQQDKFTETSNQLSQKTSDTLIIIIWMSLLADIVGILVAILISRNISRKVKLVSTSAEEIANGNLTIEQIKVKSKDEIGQLTQSFNKMVENLRNIIQQINHTSEQVAASSEELLASAEETTAATNQVATSITAVANSVEDQGKNTEESAQGISEITTGITRIADNASAVAVSSVETAKQANMGNDNIQSVVKQMSTISQANSETNHVIQELEKRSTEIGKIIEVITNIADQTNLLALNAAIESARAGEHGKGFAVVADEVRKLAEQSRESANQISEIIQFIQTDTSRAAELMNKGTHEVTNGLKLAEVTGKTFEVILKSIENANAQSQELSATSEEISASVGQVNASIDEVSQLAKASSTSAIEIAAVTEEQLASTEEVSTAATSLANMAEELRGFVSKFKI